MTSKSVQPPRLPLFDCTGLFNHEEGYACSGYFLDGGEPAGKKGNDPDQISVVVTDTEGTVSSRPARRRTVTGPALPPSP